MTKSEIRKLVEMTIENDAEIKYSHSFRKPELKEWRARMAAFQQFYALAKDESPTLEYLYCYDGGLDMIIATTDRIFQIDWSDGYGITFSEMTFPDEED